MECSTDSSWDGTKPTGFALRREFDFRISGKLFPCPPQRQREGLSQAVTPGSGQGERGEPVGEGPETSPVSKRLDKDGNGISKQVARRHQI